MLKEERSELKEKAVQLFPCEACSRGYGAEVYKRKGDCPNCHGEGITEEVLKKLKKLGLS